MPEPTSDIVDALSDEEILDALDTRGSEPRSKAATDCPAPYVLLSELLEHPELLEPPPVVLPRVAFEGRVTMLASEEKKGKSTIAGQGAARLACGEPFLGQEIASPRTVVWVAIDEPLSDLARRLHRFGARDGIAIVTERPALVPLRRTVEELGAGLLVVDTLTEWAVDDVTDFNAAEGWTRVLRGLRQLATETGCAVLLLHHVNRANGKYRGSSQLGAGVDQILEMTEDPNDQAVREIKSRGRVAIETFRLRWDGNGGYRLEAEPASLDERILVVVQANPEVSARGLRNAVGARAAEVDASVARLIGLGMVEDVGDKRGRKLRVPKRVPPRENFPHGDTVGTRGRDTGGGEIAKSLWDTPGHGPDTPSDTPACPDPLKGGVRDTLLGDGPGKLPVDEGWWAGLREPAA